MQWQPHLGLDLGANSLKLVQLEKASDGFSLLSLGQIPSPEFTNQTQWDEDRSQAVRKLVAQARSTTKLAAVSLPEAQVYTRVIELPYLSASELPSAIRWQAEQYVPIPLTDVVLKHIVLSQPEKEIPGAKMKVLLVAAPTTLIGRYTAILEKAGLEPIAVDTEVLCVARALFSESETQGPGLLLHLGAETSTIALFSPFGLTLTRSISTGGIAIARSVASELHIDLKQAEEYKKSYGLDETKLEGKVVTAIKPMLAVIIEEIRKVIAFHESSAGSQPVRLITLSGGTAFLPGLIPYLTASLGLEVVLGNPFFATTLTPEQKKTIADSGPLFATAVGLAQKQT